MTDLVILQTEDGEGGGVGLVVQDEDLLLTGHLAGCVQEVQEWDQEVQGFGRRVPEIDSDLSDRGQGAGQGHQGPVLGVVQAVALVEDQDHHLIVEVWRHWVAFFLNSATGFIQGNKSKGFLDHEFFTALPAVISTAVPTFI